MTSGFGVDPTKDGSGNITSGTTSQDIRQINSGLYSPGIISGCKVSVSSASMTYTVSAGVACIQMSSGENVLVPVPATTINAAAVPSSGTRTDYIYVTQHTPAIDGDSNVVVTYGTSTPARSLTLDQFLQPAGATTTSSGARNGALSYSIPYSGGLGRLHYYQHAYNGTLRSSPMEWVGNGTIFLPTDRMTTWRVHGVLSALNAAGFDNSKYCEYGFLPTYDETNTWVIWTTPGLHQAWQTVYWEATIPMTAGLHTVKLGMTQMVGPGTVYCHYGPDSNGYGRRGIEFEIIDAGVAQ
jgi:hypothetical protein